MPETRLQEVIIDALNEGTGIDFVRDAWIDENNDLGRRDYGVVTIDGSPSSLWADDRMVYQRISGSVILYVTDGDDEKAGRVQEVLRGLDLAFRLQSNEFDRELVANRWVWTYTMEKYFRNTETADPDSVPGDAEPTEPGADEQGGG